MRTFNLLVWLLLFPFLPLGAQGVEELLALRIPVLFIETEKGELPSCDYVQAPSGCDGYSIANPTKVPGRMVMVQTCDTLYDSGLYEEGVSGMTFRIRGNTSAYGEIKPYKIKLEKKADLLQRDEDRFKDRNWVLLAKADIDLLMGYKVSELVGMPWTPSFAYVNVVINEQYAGLYQLCESVRCHNNARISLDSESGFLAEHDPYWWNEDFVIPSDYSRYHFTLKYPEVEDVQEVDSQRVAYRLHQMEQSFRDGTYDQYVDVDNFAAWMLAHDILGTSDAGGSNMYYSRFDDAESTRIQMPVLWDFDTTLRRRYNWASSHLDPISYFPYLFASENHAFLASYVRKWNELKDDLGSIMSDYIRDFASSEWGDALTVSFELNSRLNGYENHFQDVVSSSLLWFEERIPWLNQSIGGLEEQVTSVNLPTFSTADDFNDQMTNRPNDQTIQRPNDQTYNLAGQRVNARYKGLVVRGGRKYWR